MLYTAHQEVVEERCELEEAENDSRLRAQKSVAVVVMITMMMMMMMGDDDEEADVFLFVRVLASEMNL